MQSCGSACSSSAVCAGACGRRRQDFYQKLVDRLREQFEQRREKCSYTTMPGLMATIKVRAARRRGRGSGTLCVQRHTCALEITEDIT